MNKETQLQVQAYLDNELPPREARKVADLLSKDSEARALFNELKDTKQIVTTNGEVPLRLSDSREFYWSQIQRRIEAEERAGTTQHSTSWWMRLMAPIAGAVALFAILLSIYNPPQVKPTQSPSVRSQVENAIHRVENVANVSTMTFRSEEQGITVVWVSTE